MRRSRAFGGVTAAPALIAAAGLSIFATAGLLLAGAVDPLGPVGRFGAPLIAQSKGEAANLLIEAAWPRRDAALLAQARDAARGELSLSPASGEGWLRLAIIEAALTGRLSGPAAEALSNSYAVAPLDARLITPRVRFAYDHWAELTPEIRRQTLDQIDLAWPGPRHNAAVLAAAQQVTDPGGKVALNAKLFSLRRKDRIDFLNRRAKR